MSTGIGVSRLFLYAQRLKVIPLHGEVMNWITASWSNRLNGNHNILVGKVGTREAVGSKEVCRFGVYGRFGYKY